MKRIIVFTNPASLNSVNPVFAVRKDVMCLKLANPILQFDETALIFKSVTSISEPGLFFVFDTLPENNFNALMMGIDKSDCYVLKHKRNPTFLLEGYAELLPDGIHEADDKGKYYPDVVKILIGDVESKVISIFNTIFKSDPELDIWLKQFEEIAPNVIDKKLQAAAAKIKIDVKAKYNL
ncbi:MAG: hypothetical protein IPO21_19465 [Bacteroidales bacterium]|nr:hypothetical protein [Bacteroidales bacterium]